MLTKFRSTRPEEDPVRPTMILCAILSLITVAAGVTMLTTGHGGTTEMIFGGLGLTGSCLWLRLRS